MRLTVKHCKQKFAVAAEEGWTVGALKDELTGLTGVPPWRQRLVAKGGRALDDDSGALRDLGISDGAVLQLSGSADASPGHVQLRPELSPEEEAAAAAARAALAAEQGRPPLLFSFAHFDTSKRQPPPAGGAQPLLGCELGSLVLTRSVPDERTGALQLLEGACAAHSEHFTCSGIALASRFGFVPPPAKAPGGCAAQWHSWLALIVAPSDQLPAAAAAAAAHVPGGGVYAAAAAGEPPLAEAAGLPAGAAFVRVDCGAALQERDSGGAAVQKICRLCAGGGSGEPRELPRVSVRERAGYCRSWFDGESPWPRVDVTLRRPAPGRLACSVFGAELTFAWKGPDGPQHFAAAVVGGPAHLHSWSLGAA